MSVLCGAEMLLASDMLLVSFQVQAHVACHMLQVQAHVACHMLQVQAHVACQLSSASTCCLSAFKCKHMLLASASHLLSQPCHTTCIASSSLVPASVCMLCPSLSLWCVRAYACPSVRAHPRAPRLQRNDIYACPSVRAYPRAPRFRFRVCSVSLAFVPTSDPNPPPLVIGWHVL
jgi:hypothetical protein